MCFGEQYKPDNYKVKQFVVLQSNTTGQLQSKSFVNRVVQTEQLQGKTFSVL